MMVIQNQIGKLFDGGEDIDFHVSHTTKWSNSDVFCRLYSESYQVNGTAVNYDITPSDFLYHHLGPEPSWGTLWQRSQVNRANATLS